MVIEAQRGAKGPALFSLPRQRRRGGPEAPLSGQPAEAGETGRGLY